MRGQSEKWHEELKKEFSAIKVIPIDKDKINEWINKEMHKSIISGDFKVSIDKDEKGNPIYMGEADLKGVTFKMGGTYGLAFISGTQLPIDQEAIMYATTHGVFEVDIYKHRDLGEGRSEFGIFPMASISVNVNDMIKDFGKEETDLVTFMDDRFAYNDRILRNMNDNKKWLKKEKIIA